MKKTAIILLGHGSSYEYNKNVLNIQKERLESMGFNDVYIGFNELCRPYIQDTMKLLAENEYDEVIALPFFIATGVHVTRDIPPKLGFDELFTEGTTDKYGRSMKVYYELPFGIDPLLTDILYEKAMEARTEKNFAVMVIGHGSLMPYNSESVIINAKRLREKGIKAYEAFNEYNEPTVEDVLKRMISEGADEIIGLPLFISEGDHLKNDIPPKLHLKDGISSGSFEENGKTIKVQQLKPIGLDPRLTNVLAEKIRRHME